MDGRHETPEAAARSDIPKAFAPALGIVFSPDGRFALVLLGANRTSDPYPYQVVCEREGTGWVEGISWNRPGWSSTARGDEPTSASSATGVRRRRAPERRSWHFGGREHEAPISGGYYMFRRVGSFRGPIGRTACAAPVHLRERAPSSIVSVALTVGERLASIRPRWEHTFVHAATVRQAAIDLVAQGHNDCEISRRLGVPRRTVRDWRVPPYESVRGPCLRCWRPSTPIVFTPGDYAELLGLYLGDGHVSVMARTQRLRLTLDSKYSGIVHEAADLLARVLPFNKVGSLLRHEGRMTVLHAYHGHWTCLLPQHGPGKKHERAIILEPWQESLVVSAPWAFLRGCIRSDGCVFINRTGKYAYESYDFSNRSRGILGLFVSTCARVGVECRVYEKHVRIYRRASVAMMLEHVGRKR